MTTLFISGFNDKNTATMYPGKHGGADYRYDGCCGVYGYMEFNNSHVDSLTLFGHPLKLQTIRISKKTRLLFNEISDPDSHYKSLKRCEELCSKIPLPVINHPSNILKTTRDNIPKLLKDIPGVKVPGTVRFTPLSPEDIFTEIEREDLAYPVIVRTAGSHGGISSILVNGREDLSKLHVYAFDGSAFYLTEYVDYASDDGLYSKYRIVVIGGKPLFRHYLVNNEWMVHAASREFMEENPQIIQEARTRRETFDEQTLPVIRPAIDEISRRLGLEYYGIDCHMDEEGQLLIFEVNANMNILSNKVKSMENQVERIKEQIRDMINDYAA